MLFFRLLFWGIIFSDAFFWRDFVSKNGCKSLVFCFGISCKKIWRIVSYCWWFRNPAPVDMKHFPVFTGFYTFQVVQDFFHQQYFVTSEYQQWTFQSVFFSTTVDGSEIRLISWYSKYSTRWWQLKYFWNFHPDQVGKWAKVTSRFRELVGEKNANPYPMT